jgi:hypothetical protein
MAYTSSPFAGAQIDFSALAGIGQNIGQGYQRRKLADEMQAAFGPDGTLDYNKMMQIMSASRPMEAARMATQQQGAENRFMTPVLMEDGKGGYAYVQPQSQGGGQIMDVPGYKPAPPNRYLETPNGYVPVPTRGGLGGPINAETAPPVPGATQMDVGPGADPRGPYLPGAQAQPGAIPSLKSVKQGHEMASTHATDKALAQDAISKFDEVVDTLGNLVDESGKSTEQLQTVTGNRKIGGVDTHIPNAWLPNVYEGARNASANINTAAIQIGLNALAQMRAASAQGASGMGQLAIQESVWLQNSIRSLEQTQSTPQAAKHISDIINYSKRVQDRIREKYKSIYGEDLGHVPGPQDDAPPAASGGDVNGDGIIDAKDYFGQ